MVCVGGAKTGTHPSREQHSVDEHLALLKFTPHRPDPVSPSPVPSPSPEPAVQSPNSSWQPGAAQ